MRNVLPLLVMLLIIVVCQGCLDSLEKTSSALFYLSDDFTIDSIDGKCFKSTDNSLNYKVADVYINDSGTEKKEIINISNELKEAITTELVGMSVSSNTTYALGDGITTSGDVDYGEKLVIEFDVMIEEKASGRKIDGTYSFAIKFTDESIPPSEEFNFYLCEIVTIDSIGEKSFTSDSTYLNYTVDGVSLIGKDRDTIVDELELMLITELNRKSVVKSLDYTLGSAVLSGDIGTDEKLVIKFDIEIRDIITNGIISGTYSFTIAFNDKLEPWNGLDKTEPDIDNMDNYLIKIPANLAWLSDQSKVDRNVLFLSSIDMNSKPFGGIKEFSGIFDGNNKSIKNLTIEVDSNTTSDEATALIQNITGDSIIKNLTLDGGMISGNLYIGSFVGTVGVVDDIPRSVGTVQHKLTIDNLRSNLKLVSNNSALDSGREIIMGGFIAFVNERIVMITNSTYSGEIIFNSSLKSIIGGVIGKANNSGIVMEKLVNLGNISVNGTGTNIIGGILGESVTSGTDDFIINVSGLINKGVLVNNSNHNGVTGGIIGVNQSDDDEEGENTLEIIDSNNDGDITGAHIIGGVLGLNINASIIITNTYNIGLMNGLGDTSDLVVYGSAGGIIGKNDGFDSVNISNTYNTGDVKGDFIYTGGIIGKNFSYGTTDIVDSYNNGVITGNVYTGGIIGENDVDSKMTMHRSYNRGSITSSIAGYLHIGGLIGFNKAQLTYLSESYNSGNIATSGNIVGDPLNVFIGGLLGKSLKSTSIEKTYNTGDLNIVIDIDDPSLFVSVGGLIGLGSSLTISESYNTGNMVMISKGVSVSFENYTGGIVGAVIDENRDSDITISDSYNAGDIESIGVSGGLVGDSYFDDDESVLTISKSFSYADVNGDTSEGALIGTSIGLVSATFTNNYWYSLGTPASDINQVGGTRLEVDKFILADSFEGWDFSTVWEIKTDGKYPTLVNNQEISEPFTVINK